ncbi:hypothetical protein [Actinoplanes sp. ATCC 53533]|uniref:hypothetical protein n=1 Tax=Actinoplanes sp. ATCC 53533 TaxID=1288362 RepID=UPI000F777EC7|nr:hypothetical protein [Actinoplanes sp. ATCC 53533]
MAQQPYFVCLESGDLNGGDCIGICRWSCAALGMAVTLRMVCWGRYTLVPMTVQLTMRMRLNSIQCDVLSTKANLQLATFDHFVDPCGDTKTEAVATAEPHFSLRYGNQLGRWPP